MKEKILTISVAAYNAANCITKCIESFVNSKVIEELEIIIVNDGSKDNTNEVVQEYVSKYPESVRLISKENGGHGSTINTSIKEAAGKYYKIVDSDDWVEIEGLERLVEELSRSDEDLIINPYYKVNASDESKELVESDGGDLTDKAIFEMHAMTIKTDVVKAMGPVIDEHCFYVDTEFVVFAMSRVNSMKCLDFPVYDYLLGTTTQSMNMKNLVKNRSQHIKVCKRILDYYNSIDIKKDYDNSFGINIGEEIRKRICDALVVQYIIFSHMSVLTVKAEIKEFDEYIKATSKEIYEVVCNHGISNGYNSMRVVWILRKVGFAGYIPIMGAFKFIRRVASISCVHGLSKNS